MHTHAIPATATPRTSRRYAPLLLAALLMTAAAASPATPESLSLADCLRLARERSLPLANATRELEIARESVRGVRAQVNPSLDASASYTRLDDTVLYLGPTDSGKELDRFGASLEAEQLLYAGGAVRAALRIADHYLGSARADLAIAEADLERRITRGFFEILYLSDALAVAEASLNQLADLEGQARAKYQTGLLAEFDWLNTQVALANQRPRVIAAENSLALGRRAFRDLIYGEDDNFTLAGTLELIPPDPDLEALQEQGLAARPELRRAELQTRIAREQIRIAHSEYLPEVRAFGLYGGSDPSSRDPTTDGWDWEWSAGVRLQWSIMDGGLRSSQSRTQRLIAEQADNTLVESRRRVALDIETAWRALREARQALAGAADNVRLAERALEIAGTRFTQGLATYLDFTATNLGLTQARLNRSKALLDCHQALADLRYAAALPEPIVPEETTKP